MEIVIKDLSFCYTHSKSVLSDIELQAFSDETIAFVGASGSGKSTLLRLLSGLLPHHKEQKLFGSITIDNVTPSEFKQMGDVGIMFQEPSLMPNLNVRENIEFPLRLKGKPDNTYIDHLLEMVGLSEHQEVLPSKLSGGMKTRVALARTFSTKPRMLLLDEPFAALDIRWKFILYQELEKLRSSYSPLVIMVTHDIQEALILSNHIYVFGSSGRIAKKVECKQSLPRAFDPDRIADMREEYLEIQRLILQN